MDEKVSALLLQVMLIVVPAAAVYIAGLLRQHAKKLNQRVEMEIGERKYALLTSMAREFVRAAEQQLAEHAPGKTKLAFVMDLLFEVARQHDIELPAHAIRAIVEAAVREMNEADAAGWTVLEAQVDEVAG